VTVLVQEVLEERVWAARPMRLVAETPAGAVLWFPRGTRRRVPTVPTGRPREATRAERESALVEEARDTSTLQIWPRDPWAWRADGWRGFRTMDLVLDVVAELDGSRRLKDEDELGPDPVLPEGWERPCL
jgi:hypothetical protein